MTCTYLGRPLSPRAGSGQADTNAWRGGGVVQGSEVGRRMLGLLGLSEGIRGNGAFARQARRKYVG